MIPHRPASGSPAEQVTNAPTIIAAIIDLQDHTAPSFLPYPGKDLTVDVSRIYEPIIRTFHSLSIRSSFWGAILQTFAQIQ
jgi:hypothetical protein